MKRILCVLLLLIPAGSLWALDLPALTGYVNDTADMIDQPTEDQIVKLLSDLETSDSTQVVVVTVNSLEGLPIEEYGIKLADTWKIGRKKRDNGVIFLVSKNDRKMRIEVGRGVEGVLTDLLSGRIVDTIVAPLFKEGKYDEGFLEGSKAIVQAVKGEYVNDGKDAKEPSPFSAYVIFMLIGFYFVVVFISSFSKIVSGLAGAGALPAIVHFGVMPIGITGWIIAGVIGLIAAFILPFIPIGGSSGRSGRRSGSSSIGSSGGGFSGGGGSFGGGGASGGW